MPPTRALLSAGVGLLAAVALAAPAVAAPGDLDLTFGQDGIVKINTNAPADEIDVRNGKIVLAGAPSFASSFPDEIWTIARLNATGSLDTTFSGNGLATIPWGAATEVGALAILPDNRVLIAGTLGPRIVLARRSSIGGPDASFGGGDGLVDLTEPFGYSWTSVTDVLVLPSGKFVVSAVISSNGSAYPGRTPFGLVGFNADGSLDTTFGDGGVRLGPLPPEMFSEGASTLALDSAGRIVAGGGTSLSQGSLSLRGPAMQRFNSTGAHDTSFGGEGGVFRPLAPPGTRADFARLFPQPDGTLVGAGPQREPSTNAGIGSSALVTRHKSNGRLDPAFDSDGRALVGVTLPGRNASAVNVFDADRRPDGRITFIGGNVNLGTFLLRVRPDGTRDPAFGPSVALPDLQPNVALATSFPFPVAMATQSDGRILVIGASGTESQFRLARFQSECLTTISCVALASNVTGSGVTISSTVRSSDISLGILVHRLVGHRRVLVGRRPFGPRSRGRARLRWNFRVNGRRLRAGRYLITVRALNRRGKVIDLSRSILIRVPAAPRR